MGHPSGDQWQIEADLIGQGITDHYEYLFSLVDSVDVPVELFAHVEAADRDSAHLADFDEWLTYLSECDLFLAVEQSCDADGLLLGWDMRAVRLQTLPPAMLAKLHFFFDRCPLHTRALLVHYVFWLARFERIHRQASPVWTKTAAAIEDNEEPAFFRPNRLTIRRQGR